MRRECLQTSVFCLLKPEYVGGVFVQKCRDDMAVGGRLVAASKLGLAQDFALKASLLFTSAYRNENRIML
jgi:hypothetical protein